MAWHDGQFASLPWVGLGATSGGGPSTLLTGLTAYWKFDETSGTRVDQIGNFNLSTLSSPAPAAVAGLISNAIRIPGDRYADAGKKMSPPGTFTFAGWVNFASVNAGNVPLIIFGQQTVNLCFWFVQRQNQVELRLSNNNTTVTNVFSGGSLSAGVNYFFVFYYDDAAHEIGISINNGAFQTAPFTGPVFDSADHFQVGNSVNGSADYWLDETGCWYRMLTATEVTTAYNGGSGVTYPFTGFMAPAPQFLDDVPAEPGFFERHRAAVLAAGAALLAGAAGAHYILHWF